MAAHIHKHSKTRVGFLWVLTEGTPLGKDLTYFYTSTGERMCLTDKTHIKPLMNYYIKNIIYDEYSRGDIK